MTFPTNPGDRLLVTQDNPFGTDLQTGDIVTVITVGYHHGTTPPAPVVQVSTAYGPLLLTYDVVTPVPAVDYTPAEPDDVVDAFFFGMLGADDDLRAWAITAREELAKNDPGAEPAPTATGTAVADRPKRTDITGDPFELIDPDGDLLEVFYFEQDCPRHGRESGFYLTINEDESVVIPLSAVDGLIRYLFEMRKHANRPESE